MQHRKVILLSVRSADLRTAMERRADMPLVGWLTQEFNVLTWTYSECGGAIKVIACIEEP